MTRGHYETLGLTPDAEQAQIRQAFRALSREHHPDLGGDRTVYASITEAFTVLSDPEQRAAYDRSIGLASASEAGSGTARPTSGTSASTSSPSRQRTAPTPKPVRYTGQASPDFAASMERTLIHGSVPKRGLLDRTRDARTAVITEMVTQLAREIPAVRAILGPDIPGAGRIDAAIVAGNRILVVNALPTPDVAHAWDGRSLRVGGRVVTLPDLASAVSSTERAVFGSRAESLCVLYTAVGELFRPVVDQVGPRHARPGPANPSRARLRAAEFLGTGPESDAVNLSILGQLMELAPTRR